MIDCILALDGDAFDWVCQAPDAVEFERRVREEVALQGREPDWNELFDEFRVN